MQSCPTKVTDRPVPVVPITWARAQSMHELNFSNRGAMLVTRCRAPIPRLKSLYADLVRSSNRATISRTRRVFAETMTTTATPPDTLTHLVERARALYSLPAVAMKVIELTNNPRVDAAKLKACIENDPALTIKILRTVNSSLFGLARQVSDLNQALALLGTKPLKLLVLGFSLPKELFTDVQAEVLSAYWRHTLTKAVAAREIAESIWSVPGDEPFIAGLLQDLGVLVMLQDLGEPFAAFLEKVRLEQCDLANLENATLGFDHTALTSNLLDHWGLPESLVSTVAAPRDADALMTFSPENRDVAQILHLAELVAQLLAGERADALAELLAAGGRYRGLTSQQLSELVQRLEEKVLQMADVLSLSLPDGINYQDVLARAHGQLSEVAADAVGELARNETERHLGWQESRSLVDAASQFGERASRGELRVHDREPPAENASDSRPKGNAADGSAAAAPGAPARMAAVQSALVDQINASVAECRQERCPLSLLLVELDAYEKLVLAQGSDAAENVVRLLKVVTAAFCKTRGASLRAGDARFAVILEDYDRRQAVEAADQLVRGLHRWSQDRADEGDPLITVSIGVATVAMPPKNFPATDLLEAVERCLYGAKASGGNGLKSIDIY